MSETTSASVVDLAERMLALLERAQPNNDLCVCCGQWIALDATEAGDTNHEDDCPFPAVIRDGRALRAKGLMR